MNTHGYRLKHTLWNETGLGLKYLNLILLDKADIFFKKQDIYSKFNEILIIKIGQSQFWELPNIFNLSYEDLKAAFESTHHAMQVYRRRMLCKLLSWPGDNHMDSNRQRGRSKLSLSWIWYVLMITAVLECDAVQLGTSSPALRENVFSPSTEYKTAVAPPPTCQYRSTRLYCFTIQEDSNFHSNGQNNFRTSPSSIMLFQCPLNRLVFSLNVSMPQYCTLMF